nr:GH3 auxin-responsive promoter family protein [Mangrovicoccus ximenensis]
MGAVGAGRGACRSPGGRPRLPGFCLPDAGGGCPGGCPVPPIPADGTGAGNWRSGDLGFHPDGGAPRAGRSVAVRAGKACRAQREARQARLLRRLLARAARTRFGAAHGFDRIAGPQDFAARVPLRGYDAFWQEWWQPGFPEIIDATWPGRIPYFALSSGTTTGRSKHIPYTPQMRRAAGLGFLDLLCFHLAARPQSRVLGGAALGLVGPVALETEGARPLDAFATVALPLAAPGILTGAILGFAHTVGEFGVVLMIGGAIPGKTKVISITIFDYVETLDWAKAHLLAGGMLGFSFAVILAMTLAGRRLSGARP